MKVAIIITRLLMGGMFLFASIVVLFNLVPHPELSGKVKVFMDGIEATGYLLTTVKIFELLCGIAFIVGRFVPLATVVIFPIILNILMFHLFLDPSGLLIAILLMIGNLFLAYTYRAKYKPLFVAK
jgi:uncharacterized membrane protein YphA (DoxX/SURF4 family)